MNRMMRFSMLAVFSAFLAMGRWPAGIPGAFGDQVDSGEAPPKTGMAADFPNTIVSAHTEQAITPGKNVLWCSTMQLAWNEACTLLGEDIHLVDEPPMVAILNKKEASKNDLDDASYVAMAGWGRDGIIDQVRQALVRKFPNEEAGELLPSSLDPNDMLAYAFLFKSLEFPVPFGNLDTPLVFGGTPVASFGTESGKADQGAMYDQVAILDYQGPDSFVVELKTKTAEDQVILARVQPGATLQTTIQEVLARIKSGTPEPMVGDDVLQVPKLNFKIIRGYKEIEGKRMVLTQPPPTGDLWMKQATQSIRFLMNEKGVKLVSEAVMIACTASASMSMHTMVFDQPFLIIMKRAQATQPYFALWVDNPELLVTQ